VWLNQDIKWKDRDACTIASEISFRFGQLSDLAIYQIDAILSHGLPLQIDR
jgi:hypothetical protein